MVEIWRRDIPESATVVVYRTIDWDEENGFEYKPDWKQVLKEWNQTSMHKLSPEFLAAEIIAELPQQQGEIDRSTSDEMRQKREYQKGLLETALDQILNQFEIEKPEVI